MSIQNKAILIQRDILKNLKELNKAEIIGDVMLKICDWRLSGVEPKKEYEYYFLYISIRNNIISGDEAYDERVNKLKEYRKSKISSKEKKEDTKKEDWKDRLSADDIIKIEMAQAGDEQKRLQKELARQRG